MNGIVAQSVVVTALDNDIAEGDRVVTIEHRLSGPGSGENSDYDGVDSG